MSAHYNPSEPQLLALLNEGHRGAFDMIYRRYAKELFRYARKNISVKEDCEEIIQDVFVSLWARHETLRITSLRAYLINMVRYKMIRYFRHNEAKKKYAEHYRFFELVYDSIQEEERGPDAIMTMMEKSIADLPHRCQVAIKLRISENLSNREIAERMNITKKTVELYMFKAFSHLRASGDRILKLN